MSRAGGTEVSVWKQSSRPGTLDLFNVEYYLAFLQSITHTTYKFILIGKGLKKNYKLIIFLQYMYLYFFINCVQMLRRQVLLYARRQI